MVRNLYILVTKFSYVVEIMNSFLVRLICLHAILYMSYVICYKKVSWIFFNRRFREQASIAMKNISTNPDRTSALSALSQVAVARTHSQQEASSTSDSSGAVCSDEKNTQRPSTGHLSRTPSSGALLDRDVNSKLQRTTSELTSMLSLVFQSDTLWGNGSERQFLRPTHLAERRVSRLKQTNSFSKKDKYLNSLRVLTNTLVVMSNMILISGSVEDKSGEMTEEVRWVFYL